ncbi:MAG: hypothetical protein R3C27_15060 [Hyphomonadaceae bacterium]
MGMLLTRLGFVLLFAGFAAIIGIFGTVMVLGHWPDFLAPVRGWFEFTHRYLGGFSYILALGVFVLPGWVLLNLGDAIDPDRRH